MQRPIFGKSVPSGFSQQKKLNLARKMPRKLEGKKLFPENCFRENQKTEKRLQIILKPHLLFGVAVVLVFAFSQRGVLRFLDFVVLVRKGKAFFTGRNIGK